MKRSVTRWMAMKPNGTLAEGEVPYRTRKHIDTALWPNEVAVRVTITYNDGRPSRSGAKRTKGGKRA